MAKPNYSFAKRQREIAKKQKKEEKRLRKAGTDEPASAETLQDAQQEVAPPAEPVEKPLP